MSETVASALWQRLDTPGHDACLVRRLPHGWRLSGTAVFRQENVPCQLQYQVDADAQWRSVAASVAGWSGADRIEVAIAALEGGRWTLNGVEQPLASGCVDIDLGFTPATNLILLRRLELPLGVTVPAPAAWMEFPDLRLQRLEQSYRRLDERRFDYRGAPAYEGVLVVDGDALIVEYPGLWSAVR
ncbi:putative glycolipid-binding domain-containing protein [Piscinibacter sp. XHJ-5]|uniref:putative glycolipid-binding domain-containing protein n=1 Tax=Piscinibacter sp. XHJ-5 TaxID=3037797 RepID=UPI002452B5B9|nr:putative glycolipid-binding domain-containing protein [Piscinibacter sp. XHJ-5]